jgi:hypothetical protein
MFPERNTKFRSVRFINEVAVTNPARTIWMAVPLLAHQFVKWRCNFRPSDAQDKLLCPPHQMEST